MSYRHILHQIFNQKLLQILSAFIDLQKSNGIIPEKNGFFEYPECYANIDKEYQETVFMEDLKEKRFEMADNNIDPITIDHARLVLSRLGKYHALSLALKTKSPEKFQNLVRNIPEVFLDEKRTMLIGYMDALKTSVEGVLKENETELRAKLNKVFGNSYFYGTKRLVEGSSGEPYSVICHGDFKTNNLMFKFDEVSCSMPFTLTFTNEIVFCRTENRLISVLLTGRGHDMLHQ